MTVFALYLHDYDRGDSCLLGVYSSLVKAQDVLQWYKYDPGGPGSLKDTLVINEFVIDPELPSWRYVEETEKVVD